MKRFSIIIAINSLLLSFSILHAQDDWIASVFLECYADSNNTAGMQLCECTRDLISKSDLFQLKNDSEVIALLINTIKIENSKLAAAAFAGTILLDANYLNVSIYVDGFLAIADLSNVELKAKAIVDLLETIREDIIEYAGSDGVKDIFAKKRILRYQPH